MSSAAYTEGTQHTTELAEPAVEPWSDFERLSHVAALGIVQLPEEEEALCFLYEALQLSRLPKSWQLARDGAGRAYFADPLTGASSWTHPLEASLRELADVFRLCMGTEPELRELAVASLVATWEEEASKDMEPWVAMTDPKGATFFSRKGTTEISWVDPAEVLLPRFFMKASALQRLRSADYKVDVDVIKNIIATERARAEATGSWAQTVAAGHEDATSLLPSAAELSAMDPEEQERSLFDAGLQLTQKTKDNLSLELAKVRVEMRMAQAGAQGSLQRVEALEEELAAERAKGDTIQEDTKMYVGALQNSLQAHKYCEVSLASMQVRLAALQENEAAKDNVLKEKPPELASALEKVYQEELSRRNRVLFEVGRGDLKQRVQKAMEGETTLRERLTAKQRDLQAAQVIKADFEEYAEQCRTGLAREQQLQSLVQEPDVAELEVRLGKVQKQLEDRRALDKQEIDEQGRLELQLSQASTEGQPSRLRETREELREAIAAEEADKQRAELAESQLRVERSNLEHTLRQKAMVEAMGAQLQAKLLAAQRGVHERAASVAEMTRARTPQLADADAAGGGRAASSVKPPVDGGSSAAVDGLYASIEEHQGKQRRLNSELGEANSQRLALEAQLARLTASSELAWARVTEAQDALWAATHVAEQPGAAAASSGASLGQLRERFAQAQATSSTAHQRAERAEAALALERDRLGQAQGRLDDHLQRSSAQLVVAEAGMEVEASRLVSEGADDYAARLDQLLSQSTRVEELEEQAAAVDEFRRGLQQRVDDAVAAELALRLEADKVRDQLRAAEAVSEGIAAQVSEAAAALAMEKAAFDSATAQLASREARGELEQGDDSQGGLDKLIAADTVVRQSLDQRQLEANAAAEALHKDKSATEEEVRAAAAASAALSARVNRAEVDRAELAARRETTQAALEAAQAAVDRSAQERASLAEALEAESLRLKAAEEEADVQKATVQAQAAVFAQSAGSPALVALVAASEQRRAEASVRVASTEASLAEAAEQSRLAEGAVAAKQEEARRYLEESDALEADLARVRAELVEVQREQQTLLHEVQKASAAKELAAALASTQAAEQRLDLQRSLSEAEGELRESRDASSIVRARVDAVEAQLAAERQQAALADAKLREAQAQLAAERQQVSLAEVELQEAQALLSAERQRAASADAGLQEARAQLDTERRQLAQAQSELEGALARAEESLHRQRQSREQRLRSGEASAAETDAAAATPQPLQAVALEVQGSVPTSDVDAACVPQDEGASRVPEADIDAPCPASSAAVVLELQSSAPTRDSPDQASAAQPDRPEGGSPEAHDGVPPSQPLLPVGLDLQGSAAPQAKHGQGRGLELQGSAPMNEGGAPQDDVASRIVEADIAEICPASSAEVGAESQGSGATGDPPDQAAGAQPDEPLEFGAPEAEIDAAPPQPVQAVALELQRSTAADEQSAHRELLAAREALGFTRAAIDDHAGRSTRAEAQRQQEAERGRGASQRLLVAQVELAAEQERLRIAQHELEELESQTQARLCQRAASSQQEEEEQERRLASLQAALAETRDRNAQLEDVGHQLRVAGAAASEASARASGAEARALQERQRHDEAVRRSEETERQAEELRSKLASLEHDLQDQQERDRLQARVAALEAAPTPTSPAAVDVAATAAALQSEFVVGAALRAERLMLEQLSAQGEELRSTNAAVAQRLRGVEQAAARAAADVEHAAAAAMADTAGAQAALDAERSRTWQLSESRAELQSLLMSVVASERQLEAQMAAAEGELLEVRARGGDADAAEAQTKGELEKAKTRTQQAASDTQRAAEQRQALEARLEEVRGEIERGASLKLTLEARLEQVERELESIQASAAATEGDLTAPEEGLDAAPESGAPLDETRQPAEEDDAERGVELEAALAAELATSQDANRNLAQAQLEAAGVRDEALQSELRSVTEELQAMTAAAAACEAEARRAEERLAEARKATEESRCRVSALAASREAAEAEQRALQARLVAESRRLSSSDASSASSTPSGPSISGAQPESQRTRSLAKAVPIPLSAQSAGAPQEPSPIGPAWEADALNLFRLLDRRRVGRVEQGKVLQIWQVLSKHVEADVAAALAAQLIRGTVPLGCSEWMELLRALGELVGPKLLHRNLLAVITSISQRGVQAKAQEPHGGARSRASRVPTWASAGGQGSSSSALSA